MNRRGQSLIELLIATGLASIIALSAGSLVKAHLKMFSQNAEYQAFQTQAFSATYEIRQIGKLADYCKKIIPDDLTQTQKDIIAFLNANPEWTSFFEFFAPEYLSFELEEALECRVTRTGSTDPNDPRVQQMVRFVQTSSGLEMRILAAGKWTVEKTFPLIAGFLLCSDTDMANPNSECNDSAKAPFHDDLNDVHTEILGYKLYGGTYRDNCDNDVQPDSSSGLPQCRNNTFYRFALRSNKGHLSIQSSFFVRNARPSVDGRNILYSWN